ncbi:MAG: preprotein translocase subunit SecG [bacterium]
MGFVLTIHVFVSILLVAMILLQVGRGASTGAAFGGGVRTFFGPSGAITFLGKVIVVLAVIFIVTTVILSVLATGGKPPKIETQPQESSKLDSTKKILVFRRFIRVSRGRVPRFS